MTEHVVVGLPSVWYVRRYMGLFMNSEGDAALVEYAVGAPLVRPSVCFREQVVDRDITCRRTLQHTTKR